MPVVLSPPHEAEDTFRDVAVRVAWWLGGAETGDDPPAVEIHRLAPMLDLRHIEPPASVDPRIALRLTRIDAAVVPVASLESHATALPRLAAEGRDIVVTDRAGLDEAAQRELRGIGPLFDADMHRNPAEALAWLAVSARLGQGGAGRDAWASLRRATRGAGRIVLAGPDAGSDDRRAVADEVLGLDPVTALEWSRPPGRPVLVALDDPVRHLGPSRSAAALRDGVIALAEEDRGVVLCVPAAAAALMRSRLSRTLWDRLVPVDVAARLDPGPATLLAAAATLTDTVDVVGFNGAAAPLSPDEAAVHPAYAATPRHPADLSDVVDGARAAGVRVACLTRTGHAGLCEAYRGRAPTRLSAHGVSLQQATFERFDPDGTRHVRLAPPDGAPDAVGVWHAPADGGPPFPEPAAVFGGTGQTRQAHPWPREPAAQAEAILAAADAAAPALVLTPPAPEAVEKPPPWVTVEGGRRLLGADLPEGPFADTDDERAALYRTLRLRDRDLDRVHASRLAALRDRLEGLAVLVAPGFDWSAINADRLADRPVAVIDTPACAVPDAVRHKADPLIVIATTAAARAADDAPADPGVVRLTALRAAHRGGADDIVFDPADYPAAVDPSGSPVLALQLMRALKVEPVVTLGIDPGDLPDRQPDVVTPRDPRRPELEAVRFHDLFRDGDWKGAPRVLVALGEGAPLAALDRALEGLGSDCLAVVALDGRVRVVPGDRPAVGVRVAVPAYVPGDPKVREAAETFAPAVMVATAQAPLAPLPDVPLVTLGQAADGRPAVPLPGGEGAHASPEADDEAARDRLRRALAGAVRTAAAAAERARMEAAGSTAEGWIDEVRDRQRLRRERSAEQARRPRGLRRRLARSGALASDAAAALFRSRLAARFPARRPGVGDSEGGAIKMSDTSMSRNDGFASLWPWTGNIFLVLFAAWCFYMGWMAGMEDLSRAFYGLGGVTVLVLLLGLRAAVAGTVRGDGPRRRPAFEEEEEGFNPADGGGQAGPLPAQSRPAAAAPDPSMPMNARMRAEAEAGGGIAQGGADEPPTAAGAGADDRPDTGPDIGAPDAAGGQEQPAAPPPPQGRGGGARFAQDDPARGLRQLEAWINREKAERGAQITRLDAALSDLTGRLDGLDERLAQVPSGDEARFTAFETRLAAIEETVRGLADRPAPEPERLAALEQRVSALDESVGGLAERPAADEERLAALEARVGALAERVEAAAGTAGAGAAPADLGEQLQGYLKVEDFNNAIRGKLLPQVKQMIERRLDERLDPGKLRETLAPLAPQQPSGGVQSADADALAERVAGLRADLDGANEAARAEHQDLRAAMEATRALAEKAAEGPAQASGAPSEDIAALRAELAALGEAREADRREIAELREALAKAGPAAGDEAGQAGGPAALAARIEAVEQRVAARDEETRRSLEEMRRNLEAVTGHVSRMGQNYQDLLGRVETMGDEQKDRPPEPAAPADVEALRDALTTIIEQNREIRAQQDLLTARFDRPTRVEVDTENRDDRDA